MVMLGVIHVRYIYIALSLLAIVPIFLCLSNLKSNRISKRSAPAEYAKARLLLLHNSEDSQSDSGDVSSVSDSPKQPNRDVTDGILAKELYEPGFADPRPKVCPNLGKNLELLMLITSAPDHEEERVAIRKTWGEFAVRHNVAVGFMLGVTTNKTVNKMIEKEQKLYGDVIRAKFMDSYDNLTLKSISVLEWIDNYCPKVPFAFKTDDDMFINVHNLLAFTKKRNVDEKIIFGRLAKNWKPIRDQTSKYYISHKQYESEVFPEYTTGPAYFFPAHLAKDLYLAGLNHTYFKLEDVFLTGLVASSLNIKRERALEFINRRITFTQCNLRKQISFHPIRGPEQYLLWKTLHSKSPKSCKR